MTPRVTQSDIARRAGVHNTTVSLALRNSPSIPVETRKRIQALAEEMGYRPDPALQSLMVYRKSQQARRRTTTLAYVTNCETEFAWRGASEHAKFYEGAARRATELGFQLEHFWMGAPQMNHRRLSDIFFHRGISALILASDFCSDDRPIEFNWNEFSSVRIDPYPPRPALHYVTNDQRAIVRLAVRKVIASGYRRIGFAIPAAWDRLLDRAFSAGFAGEQALLDPADAVPTLPCADTTEIGESRWPVNHAEAHEVFTKWYRRHLPEVIIGYGPIVRPRLEQLGLRVPQDVAFVDIVLEDCSGAVAGVRHNSHRVGEVAVELVAGQLQHGIRGVPSVPMATLVQGSWFDGATLPPLK